MASEILHVWIIYGIKFEDEMDHYEMPIGKTDLSMKYMN